MPSAIQLFTIHGAFFSRQAFFRVLFFNGQVQCKHHGSQIGVLGHHPPQPAGNQEDTGVGAWQVPVCSGGRRPSAQTMVLTWD